MTIRQTIEKLLSRGSVPDDPDERVEIALVSIASGPMTVASLCESGFEATGAESFNIVTNVLSDYRILVPRWQAAEATARLQDLW
jgi:hypothetical protein